MWYCHRGTREWVQVQALGRAWVFVCFGIARILALTVFCSWFGLPGFCQDSGSAASEFHGRGVEISVTVRDATGEPLTSEAMVRVYRDGSIPSASGETSRGRAVLVANYVGDFTIIVKAAGYEDAQKDISVQASGRVEVDVYLRRASNGATPAGVPGRPLLAPKAKKAVDKGLEALGENNLPEAKKNVDEAMRLAPGHPDVLYAQGVLSLKQQKWTEAQTALEKATQVDPNHARAFAALGMALCDQGKYGDAIAPLEKSLQLNVAGSWETRWTLAKAYYQHEQYDDALKMSQAALADSKGNAPEIALLVAQSLAAVGRYEEAAQTLREFLKEHGDRKEAATAQRWLDRLTVSGKLQKN
jgi:Tfp pilus assembly protein PilF